MLASNKFYGVVALVGLPYNFYCIRQFQSVSFINNIWLLEDELVAQILIISNSKSDQKVTPTCQEAIKIISQPKQQKKSPKGHLQARVILP